MMRLVALLALAALGACKPDGSCDFAVTRDIAFTHDAARETVTARALGDACDRAVGVYVVADAEGRPIWSWSAPLHIAFGEVFHAEDSEAMRDFLQRWAQPELMRASTAPEWARLAPGQTTLDETTYEDIRARDTPVLCHFSGSLRQTCVFWEPAAGAAGHFYNRNAEETDAAAAPQEGQ